MQRLLIALFSFIILSQSSLGFAKNKPRHYLLEYHVELRPTKDIALVEIRLPNAKLINNISFTINPKTHRNFKSNGDLNVNDNIVSWSPKGKQQYLRFKARLSHHKNKDTFDALATRDWAIFRGDKLIPSARVKSKKNSQSTASLHFKLPKGWSNVDTGWPKHQNGHFIIDNPERRFDRPTGWIIAGKVGSRRDYLTSTEVAVAAPSSMPLRRMDILNVLNNIWPEAERSFHKLPKKILIVGAGNPMWRGALSSPNSFYMHSDRPIVSENGTSTLLHELFHVITRIRGKKGHDWIAEGLAEYYSIELQRRSASMNQTRYQKVHANLADWSKDVSKLRVKNSRGPTTARAVILLKALDSELREHTQGQYNLDHVTRTLMLKRKVSTNDLRQAAALFLQKPSKVLDSELLTPIAK